MANNRARCDCRIGLRLSSQERNDIEAWLEQNKLGSISELIRTALHLFLISESSKPDRKMGETLCKSTRGVTTSASQ